MKKIVLIVTHCIAIAIGFVLGIYTLPILTEPSGPSTSQIIQSETSALYFGDFHRDLVDSDLLHWGEGRVAIGNNMISLEGKLAPGPDYKLYLSPIFVETEADFLKHKSQMVLVGDVKTFNNFVVPVPKNVNIEKYNAVIIWCESFGQFITATKYK